VYPILVEFGPLRIPTYGVLMALGFLCAMWSADRRAKTANIDRDRIADLFVIIIACSIIGSRALHVILNWSHFAQHPLEIPALWKGGLVFFGGLCLSIPCAVVYVLRAKLSIGRVGDVLAPSIALGHVFGRIGCFMYGCCYGRPTDLPWGVNFPGQPSVFRHPTQLYEAFAELCIFLLLSWYWRRPHKRGSVFTLYLILYPCFRFFCEFLRGDDRGGTFLFNLSIAQNTSMLLVAVALVVMGWLVYRQKVID